MIQYSMPMKNILDTSHTDTKPLSLEQLRTRLRPADAFDSLEEVQDILRDQWEVLTKNQIEALKLQVDIQFKLLSKIIPDVKTMDHSMGNSAGKVNFILNLGDNATLKDIKEVHTL